MTQCYRLKERGLCGASAYPLKIHIMYFLHVVLPIYSIAIGSWSSTLVLKGTSGKRRRSFLTTVAVSVGVRLTASLDKHLRRADYFFRNNWTRNLWSAKHLKRAYVRCVKTCTRKLSVSKNKNMRITSPRRMWETERRVNGEDQTDSLVLRSDLHNQRSRIHRCVR